jgi:hypothetical protein
MAAEYPTPLGPKRQQWEANGPAWLPRGFRMGRQCALVSELSTPWQGAKRRLPAHAE